MHVEGPRKTAKENNKNMYFGKVVLNSKNECQN